MKGKKQTETHQPSAAVIPSRLFNSPLRLKVVPSSILLVASLGAIGVSVNVESQLMPQVNAASKSSNSNIHLGDEGTEDYTVLFITFQRNLTMMEHSPLVLLECYCPSYYSLRLAAGQIGGKARCSPLGQETNYINIHAKLTSKGMDK
jgi:hypothetical protein